MSDDIIDRLRCAYSKGDEPPCEACTFCVARAEIERLRAEVERLTGHCEGHYETSLSWCRTAEQMLHQRNAERALADQLAEALRWSWELTEATHDEVFGTMVVAHGALAAHKEARRG